MADVQGWVQIAKLLKVRPNAEDPVQAFQSLQRNFEIYGLNIIAKETRRRVANNQTRTPRA